MPHDDTEAGNPLLDYRGRQSPHRPHSPGRPPTPPSPTPSSPPQRTTPRSHSFSRRRTLRSRSPASTAHLAAKKKYIYASFFLVVSLIAFTVQTELAAWVQKNGWNKAYCMLYLTHGSWSLLWPVQLAVLWFQSKGTPWAAFWRRHVAQVASTGTTVERGTLDVHKAGRGGGSPWRYLLRATSGITVALTVAGLSWYIAVNLTSPSDLTAIYNCSAFFAYAFSVPLLREKLRLDKAVAVGIAVAGVFIVAYGDSKVERHHGESDVGGEAKDRLLGNLIIGGGSVLYGLYEVLYKRYACPPEGCSPGRSVIFANSFGSMIGAFTLTVLWIPIPIAHWMGWEIFEVPQGKVALYLFLSIIANATFAGSFLVLISLTNPVLGAVSGLLTIFMVAVVDWWLTGAKPSFAGLVGFALIVVAFTVLSWSTYREMLEEERSKEVDLSEGEEDEDSDA